MEIYQLLLVFVAVTFCNFAVIYFFFGREPKGDVAMKIYLLEQNSASGYETFFDCVVIARNAGEADPNIPYKLNSVITNNFQR